MQPVRRKLGVCVWAGLLVLAVSAPALTADNPYSTIVERNAFALKPPTPPVVAQPPAAQPANVELRGITTLLGRPQVLLNFKVPGKPPEPPKDRSVVMDIDQRVEEVHVLDINPATGTVRIRNQGNELTMNLKDNAAKPQAAPGLITPALPPKLGLPAPANLPAVSSPGATPGGGATSASLPSVPSMPTRSLRANPGAAAATTAQPAAAPLTAVEQAAIMEVERERTKDAVAAGKMPPLPPLPYSEKESTTPK